ncbi:hypothetical protein [Streptomyces fungicidicus]|uniref:hypothetical protein n=1 Tax=Streptomyces fungicidicus TaxID=68203 RepID=UPI00380ED7E7
MAKRSEPEKTMTKEEWIEQQLANVPEPTAEDVWWVLNRFGFPAERVEAAYQAMLREREETRRSRAALP